MDNLIVEVFRAKVRSILEERGVTPYAVSVAAGERPGWLGDALNPKRNPASIGSHLIEAVARALGVHWSELLGQKDCPEWEDKVSGPMTWEEAMGYAESLGDGWRLPSIHELFSVADPCSVSPATNLPGMPRDLLWSSSSYAGNPFSAWVVDFHDGRVSSFDKTLSYYVRCVRSGPK